MNELLQLEKEQHSKKMKQNLFLLVALLGCSLVAADLTTHTTCMTLVVDSEVDESPQCLLCEDLVQELQEELTEDAFMSALHEVCSFLPTYLDTCPIDAPLPGDPDFETCPVEGPQADCNQMVDDYGPMVYDLLANTSPGDICEILMIC